MPESPDFWTFVDENRAIIIAFFVMLGSILWPKQRRPKIRRNERGRSD